MTENIETVVILGSGPAGSTAALYAARANLQPLVIEGPEPGGQLTTTTLVENYPGFVDGVQGPEIVETMKRQAERFGARYRTGYVKSVNLSVRPFIVHTDEGDHPCQALIIATGASARLLGLESEKKLMGRGVSTCATCDGFFFRGKKIIVAGGGDSAMEEATFLTKFAEKVYVIHRRDQLRASQIMQKRAFGNPKIEFIWNAAIEDILDVKLNKVTAVRLRNVQTNDSTEMPIDGVFLAIGHVPNTGFLEGQVNMDKVGYVVCRNGASKTSVEGVFAAGDVMDPTYKQAVTAAGLGCRAAIDCDHYLASLRERQSG